MCTDAQTALEMNNMKEDAITGHSVCTWTLMKTVEPVSFCVNLCRKLVCCFTGFLFHKQLFHRIREETDGDNNLNPPGGRFFCS